MLVWGLIVVVWFAVAVAFAIPYCKYLERRDRRNYIVRRDYK
jgi:hypothetical protein